jgi:formate dehydrogenase subunit delta
MNAEHLIQMANQIGLYHDAFPNHKDAVDGVFSHLRRSWEPRMRTAIYQHLDQHGGAGMHPLVLEALTSRRAELEPRAPQKTG